MSDRKNYTAEVLRAMEAQGIAPVKQSPPGPPPGHLRYHLAVGETVLSGVAPITHIAAQLRMLADQIESSKGASNG
jgi:hypothetical protein